MPYIYVIVGDGVSIKVGLSIRPKYRLRQLQTASPVPLHLFGAINVQNQKLAEYIERAVHRILRPRRLSGEWYFMPPDQAMHIITSIAAKRMRGVVTQRIPDTEPQDEVTASRMHPAMAVQCECGHRAVLHLSKKEIWRKRFRCSYCDRSIEGRRFFVRRVA